MSTEVPEGWWKTACEVVSLPMACVSEDSKFVWVNTAFERLVGYSRSELREKSWMDITIQEDVGGDLASVNNIIDGIDAQYTISKRYKHKFGKTIPIELTVWRFPQAAHTPMLCFIVEAVPEKASQQELDEVRTDLLKVIEAFSVRVKLLEEQQKKGAVSVSYQNADRGGRNESNSAKLMIAMAVVMALCVGGVAAMVLSGSITIGTPRGNVQIEGNGHQSPPASDSP